MAVDPYLPALRPGDRFDADLVADGAVDQFDHAMNQSVRIKTFGQQRLRAREGEQAAGQRRSPVCPFHGIGNVPFRSEEHTSELQSLMRISYAVFCLKKKKQTNINTPRLV